MFMKIVEAQDHNIFFTDQDTGFFSEILEKKPIQLSLFW